MNEALKLTKWLTKNNECEYVWLNVYDWINQSIKYLDNDYASTGPNEWTNGEMYNNKPMNYLTNR